MKAHEVALWARTRATTFRIDAHAAERLSLYNASADMPGAKARLRFARALSACAEIMDTCAEEIEAGQCDD